MKKLKLTRTQRAVLRYALDVDDQAIAELERIPIAQVAAARAELGRGRPARPTAERTNFAREMRDNRPIRGI